MKPPTLTLERLGRQELPVGALLIIESIEQHIRIDPPVQPRILKDRERFLRVMRRRVIASLGTVVTRFLGVDRVRSGRVRGREETLR